ncbi:hypothetical protein ATE84_4604 [Aquimarina sp. MAR_2010_214]|uniref:hypothetical protein n=1 Tax=Aquimarina sp. MAR_2010_214 TaxID=1250026 RepID=UPI000C7106F7|nr:hypothetical protein [Aquimarina sp. MAR_2010_214]PKV52488.1 hypothetical protein ATE84_4604 [Aquimarina sp. MAR_2010_214]
MITNTIFLEVGNLNGLVYFILLILLGPPIFLSIIGIILFKTKNRKAGKIFFILAGIYLIVGLGICGALMAGF